MTLKPEMGWPVEHKVSLPGNLVLFTKPCALKLEHREIFRHRLRMDESVDRQGKGADGRHGKADVRVVPMAAERHYRARAVWLRQGEIGREICHLPNVSV